MLLHFYGSWEQPIKPKAPWRRRNLRGPLYLWGEEQWKDFCFSHSPRYPWPFHCSFRKHIMVHPHRWRSEELNPREMGRNTFPPGVNNQIPGSVCQMKREDGGRIGLGWGRGGERPMRGSVLDLLNLRCETEMFPVLTWSTNPYLCVDFYFNIDV